MVNNLIIGDWEVSRRNETDQSTGSIGVCDKKVCGLLTKPYSVGYSVIVRLI